MRSKSGGAICTDTTIRLYYGCVKGHSGLVARPRPEEAVERPFGVAVHGLRVAVSRSFGGEACLRSFWLEELDWISGGVLDDRLIAADTDDDVAAEAGAGLAQTLDDGGYVGDFDGEAVPSTWRGQRAVWHRLATARSTTGLREYQAELATREHGERWRRMQVFVKAELLTVERNRLVNVTDDVADLY